MISVRRRGVSRLAAAIVASGLIAAGAIATAGPAAADEPVPGHSGAKAVLNGLKTYDGAVIHDGGDELKVSAGLFEMNVDNGGTIQTYCIDIHNPTQNKAQYEEKSWAESSLARNDDAGKIRWILQHSYPQINDLDALAGTAKTGTLTAKTAAAGTQVAIWRLSDKANVDAVDPQAEKLADYLVANAQNVAEPAASLTLDNPAVSGKSGDRLGPITVRTNAASATVAPAVGNIASGVKVVDRNGRAVTSAANGAELFFDVPAGAPDGSSAVTVTASTKVEVGRAFVSQTKSQTQILAGSSVSTVTATATANWAKKGAIPALSAEKDCVKGSLAITASNEGDEAFSFELAGVKHTIEAGKSETVAIPVKEDQSYNFTITGPNGFEKTFSGVLDCKTAGPAVPSSEPSPAGDVSSEDLAETGANSATTTIAGIAVALVLLGGATVFFLRRKNNSAGN